MVDSAWGIQGTCSPLPHLSLVEEQENNELLNFFMPKSSDYKATYQL